MFEERRPPNRVRGTQETDVKAQVQKQLDSFLSAQRKWQLQFEEKISRRLNDARPGPPGRQEESDTAPVNRRPIVCYNCGRPGHISRRCSQPRQFFDPSDMRTAEADVVTNNTTRDSTSNLPSNAIFIRATINRHSRLCLIDTGSEVSILPSSDAEGLDLQPSTRVLLAANGTDIRVLGEITIPLKIGRECEVRTSFLVSDQVIEPMLGMDFLRQYRVRIGFGTGAYL